ncbi:universal stress protein [Ferrimonas balearica]|uniref:universal stress protein n=1 Tax=Ferrimonas balearica TaxID=44012 RepID=UPI001C99B9CB|nr:universal stress protein [Ferrimonas balearica]MBY5991273.1 universal stress protein [Ferrimonas balearica]
MEIKEILAVTPPPESPGDPIGTAANLAKLWQANLTVLYHNQRSHDLGALNQMADELKGAGVPNVKVQGDNWDKLSDVIDAMQKLAPFDLIIKLMHHRKQSHTTDWYVLRVAHSPVLLLNPEPQAHQSRILVAMDLDHKTARVQKLNTKVLAHAKGLAESRNAELHVIYAPHLSRFLHELDMISPHEVAQTAMANCTEARAWLEAEGIPAEHIHIKPGLTGQVIRDKTCKLKVDTLVMGYFKRTGMISQLWRSNAEQLLGDLRCHMMVVPAD